MDVLERIRRGYRAIGPGAPRDVLAMFHQEEPEALEWVADDSTRIVPAREVAAMDLFAGALPRRAAFQAPPGRCAQSRPSRSARPPSFQFHHLASSGSPSAPPAWWTAARNT